MKSILEYIEDLKKNKRIALHMPGHKRNTDKYYLKELRADLDLTEISGYDDLHNPKGIIKDSIERARNLYGVKDLFYLINGSTSGNLSGIKALTKRGDKVIVARNSHKSVYNAIELLGLNAVFVYPDFVEDENFFASINPEDVRKKLDENPDATLVIITSPTYEGVISDIKTISEICHERNVKLFVDEAHGAHLSLFNVFKKSSIDLGADMCVKSLHKSLSAHTSTSILLNNNESISRGDIQRQINIFETTSPSYLLISSIDSLMIDLIENGEEIFKSWKKMLEDFRESIKDLKHLKYIDFDLKKYDNVFDFDISRIVISTKNTNISGVKLSDMLLSRGIEVEMESLKYILALTGMGEKRENLEIFHDELRKIDKELEFVEDEKINLEERLIYEDFKREMPVYEAINLKKKQVKLEESVGKVIAENVWAYPPGIPLITPGEVITTTFIDQIKRLYKSGINVNSDYADIPLNISIIE